jgi:hypothetical protein
VIAGVVSFQTALGRAVTPVERVAPPYQRFMIEGEDKIISLSPPAGFTAIAYEDPVQLTPQRSGNVVAIAPKPIEPPETIAHRVVLADHVEPGYAKKVIDAIVRELGDGQ